MDEQKFKTGVRESVTLKVTEPQLSPEQSEALIASATAASLPAPIASSSASPLAAPTAMPRTGRSPQEILADPHASEEEWLRAHQQLEEQQKTVLPAAKDRSHSRRRKFRIFAAMLVAGLAAAAYFHQAAKPAAEQVPAQPFVTAPHTKATHTTASDVDYGPYMKDLQHQIRSHWQPPKNFGSSRVGLHFKVMPSGEITDIGFDRLSHNPEADAAAIKSLLETMPTAPPLPRGATEPVDVNFTFDSMLSNGSGTANQK